MPVIGDDSVCALSSYSGSVTKTAFVDVFRFHIIVECQLTVVIVGSGSPDN